jgi:hypothetical protein
VIDLSDDEENALDSIRVNRESFSKRIDESDLQDEKHSEQRISTDRGILMDLIGEPERARSPIHRTSNGPLRIANCTEEGTTMSRFETQPTTQADPASSASLTPARTMVSSNIMIVQLFVSPHTIPDAPPVRLPPPDGPSERSGFGCDTNSVFLPQRVADEHFPRDGIRFKSVSIKTSPKCQLLQFV